MGAGGYMSIPIREYWQLLAKYLKPQKKWVALLTVLLFSVIGLRVLNPQIIRVFLDSAQAGAALQPLLAAGGLFLLFALLVQGMSVAATYVGEVVGWTATNNLRADLALHALRLDMSYHNDKTPGEMIERIDGDVMDLAIFFSQLVIQVVGNLFLLIGVLIALALEDWRVGLVTAIFSVVALVALNKMRTIAVPHWKVAREAHADLYGYLEEQLSGTEDTRSSGATDYAMRGLYANARKVIRTETKAGLAGVAVWMVWNFWHVLGRILAFVSGYLLFTNGLITIGTAYLLVYYTETIFGPLRHLTQEMEHFQKAAGSIERLRELLALQTKVQDIGTQSLPDGALAVAFDGVSFGYNDKGLVLKDVSFALPPGRVLGLLGRTGSGKTTIARLLFRLYDVTTGEIRLASPSPLRGGVGGGVPLRDVRLSDLPERIGMVTQDVQLFRATVRQNLTLFDDTIPDARVIEVIRDLELSDWFDALPKGLDTELESGGKGLSAGEGQLLAFARVFLRNPGLVILDEASSRLDPATERRIEHAIDKLLGATPGEPKRTAIIIAHRLDTVQRADDILILDGGQVAEYGERAALLRDPESRFSQLLRTASTNVERINEWELQPSAKPLESVDTVDTVDTEKV
jgi:ABC-type multidrug transport system fused ATPase/permease subunit